MNEEIKWKLKDIVIKITSPLIKTKKIRYKYGLNTTEERETRIILSLTSFPFRFPTLHICLNSLLHQIVKPDKIIVWLDDYVEEKDFTEEMIKLKDYGVEYRKVPVDLKPHKKYFWALQEFSDCIVITVDDDLLCPKTLISSLIKSYEKYPRCISARRVQKILWDEENNLLPYNKWKWYYIKSIKPRFDLLATGVGGVLYPPHILPEETFDIDKICNLSLHADDIWLKFMELKNDIPVVWSKCLIIHPPIIGGTQQIALKNTNVNKHRNDYIIANMVKEYPECKEKIISKQY